VPAHPAKRRGGAGGQQRRATPPGPGRTPGPTGAAPAAAGARRGDQDHEQGGPAREDLVGLITELTEQMHTAAAELQFEIAARLRDEIRELKHELRGMQAAGV
jgi:excinuclease ABC subunit B